MYAKFRNCPLSINKALGIFRKRVTTPRSRTTVVALGDPSGSNNMTLIIELYTVCRGAQEPPTGGVALQKFRLLGRISLINELTSQRISIYLPPIMFWHDLRTTSCSVCLPCAHRLHKAVLTSEIKLKQN